MKDDHQQDFINEKHESFKQGFALLSTKFYRAADTLTASLNRSPQTGMLCMMNSAEFFAVHSQKNLVQLS